MSSTLINFQVHAAAQFKEMVSEPTPNNVLYLTYGRVAAWANDAAPDTANNSTATEFEVWNYMIGAKKLTANDIRHVIPRYNWTSNTSYVAYDDRAVNLHAANNKFYVVTSGYNVYKCLSNNGSIVSSTMPTATNPLTTTTTSDGYIWKYMYTLSDQDLLRYTTSNYIPVNTLAADDGSTQWDVQDAATDGEISAIVITAPGSGYTNTANMTITISGDGTGATTNVTLNTISNTVASIALTDPGSDYHYATVTITGGGGTGATAKAIMSPPGGHGSDPIFELGGNRLLFNPRLVRDETANFPTTNDFRQISLILDPMLAGGAVRADNTAIFQGYTIASAGSGDYVEDEYIYQGASLAAASFSGRVLSWNATSSIVTVVNPMGTPTTGSLIGANSAITRFLTSATAGGLDKYSGKIIYVNNILPITRAPDQSEDFKILLHLS